MLFSYEQMEERNCMQELTAEEKYEYDYIILGVSHMSINEIISGDPASFMAICFACSGVISFAAHAVRGDAERIKSADVTSSLVKQDIEDGVEVYEVDFTVNGAAYDYDIRTTNGAILHIDIDFTLPVAQA